MRSSIVKIIKETKEKEKEAYLLRKTIQRSKLLLSLYELTENPLYCVNEKGEILRGNFVIYSPKIS